HRIGKVGRPNEVSHWQKRGRDYNKPPPINSLDEYAAAFRTWWSGLQPSWRGTEWPMKRERVAGETWQGTMKGGANGIVIVLIVLSWWAE
ncbi:hypothetical protein BV25DRAFT_1790249, partial [Artomyces pyxidatus]